MTKFGVINLLPVAPGCIKKLSFTETEEVVPLATEETAMKNVRCVLAVVRPWMYHGVRYYKIVHKVLQFNLYKNQTC